MTTDNKRDPADVLRELTAWLDDPSPYTTCPIGYDDLASALRDTLAENERLEMRVASLKAANSSFIDIRDERDQLRARLDKAEVVVAAVREDLHRDLESNRKLFDMSAADWIASLGDGERKTLDALAAYDKEPRDEDE